VLNGSDIGKDDCSPFCVIGVDFQLQRVLQQASGLPQIASVAMDFRKPHQERSVQAAVRECFCEVQRTLKELDRTLILVKVPVRLPDIP
jgi:hypothetical protein